MNLGLSDGMALRIQSVGAAYLLGGSYYAGIALASWVAIDIFMMWR